ncbi:hypothetical protein HC891_02770 [Candidatus Gracilibacteria bacterium]|nr:hypothetical protein [Candidatus Gracilibacteria bacterium]
MVVPLFGSIAAKQQHHHFLLRQLSLTPLQVAGNRYFRYNPYTDTPVKNFRFPSGERMNDVSFYAVRQPVWSVV